MDVERAKIWHRVLDGVFFIVVGLLAYGALYLTAQTFDKTEDRTWLLQMAGLGGSMIGGKTLHKWVENKKQTVDEGSGYCSQCHCPHCTKKKRRHNDRV